jgi:hypothetical protein
MSIFTQDPYYTLPNQFYVRSDPTTNSPRMTKTSEFSFIIQFAGFLSLGVPGVPRHTQILADQLTLFQPGGRDYAHQITTGTTIFSNLPTALVRLSLNKYIM